MKNSLLIIRLVCAILFLSNSASAQLLNSGRKATRQTFFSPGGLLDTVVDRFGNKYSLGEIALDSRIRSMATGAPASPLTPASCSSGYFELYLEPGCGFEGSDPASAARLNVLCRVFRDISSFINSPLSSTGNKVKIWVRNMGVLPVPYGVAGLASSFTSIPAVPGSAGISDNNIWVTINSGQDAHTGAGFPLLGAWFFHGVVAVQCDGSIAWHTDLSTPPGIGKYDLYTVVMHEVMHALGIASLINYDGTSTAVPGYYNRFDRYLLSPSGQHLITTSSPACDMYNWQFNPLLTPTTVLSPSASGACPLGYSSTVVNHTVCANAIRYSGSVTLPVYTPNCFEKGSSLSHFEDECYIPTGFPLSMPASNDQYFVMSNVTRMGAYNATTNPGAMKRYPTPEERKVLCDIGYRVNDTYGSVANLNNKNYGTGLCGTSIAGINDGISSSGGWTFYSPFAPVAVTINGASGASILNNDSGAVSFKCLEILSGSGTLSASSGTASTVVTFTPASGTSGLQMLRYIPVGPGGIEGNITYVFVFVGTMSCPPPASSCDLVLNGGFENTITYDTCPQISSNTVCFWSTYSGSFNVESRSCGTNPVPYPCTTPSTDAHYPGTSLAHPNDHFLEGAVWYDSIASTHSTYWSISSMQTTLYSPLIDGNKYIMGCWAKIVDFSCFSYSWDYRPVHLQFAVSPSASPLATVPYWLHSLPTGLSEIWRLKIDTTADRDWHYYTDTFTYHGPPGRQLVALCAPYLQDTLFMRSWYLLDDISLRPYPTTSTITLPDTLCAGSAPIDLSTTVTIPGGTFRWYRDSVGHAVITDALLFDPLSAYNASVLNGDSGRVDVCYTYTDMGCDYTMCGTIQILNVPLPGVSGATILCGASTTTLSSPVAGGTWTSGYVGVAKIDTLSGVVTPIAPGTATITYTAPSGCFATVVLTVDPTFGAISGPDSVGTGWHVSLTAPTAGGTWSSSDTAIAKVDNVTGIVTGVAPGTAIITYQLSAGCIDTAHIKVYNAVNIKSLTCQNISISILPNPNKGSFTVIGVLPSTTDGAVSIQVTDMLGRVTLEEQVDIRSSVFTKKISLPASIVPGVYLVRVRSNGVNSTTLMKVE